MHTQGKQLLVAYRIQIYDQWCNKTATSHLSCCVSNMGPSPAKQDKGTQETICALHTEKFARSTKAVDEAENRENTRKKLNEKPRRKL